MNEYLARIKGFGTAKHKGTTKTTLVLNEQGERVGKQTEHWSGRLDATAERYSVSVNPSLRTKREGEQ